MCNNDTQGLSNEINSKEIDDKVEDSSIRRSSKRDSKKPKHLDDYVANVEISNVAKCEVDYCYRVSNIPKSFTDAMSSNECNK